MALSREQAVAQLIAFRRAMEERDWFVRQALDAGLTITEVQNYTALNRGTIYRIMGRGPRGEYKRNE